MIVRQATKQDIEGYYGRVPCPMLGIAAIHDGAVVGIAGLRFGLADPYAFLDLNRDARWDRRAMVVARKMFRQICDRYERVYTIREKSEFNSQRFLERVGFNYSHMLPDQSEVYIWHS